MVIWNHKSWHIILNYGSLIKTAHKPQGLISIDCYASCVCETFVICFTKVWFTYPNYLGVKSTCISNGTFRVKYPQITITFGYLGTMRLRIYQHWDCGKVCLVSVEVQCGGENVVIYLTWCILDGFTLKVQLKITNQFNRPLACMRS